MNHKLIPKLTESDIVRFWNKVDVQGPNDCWEWIASIRNGYGRFSLGCSDYGSHRISYTITNEDPENLCVCHTCDNRLCVNPSHLWLGTIQEDMNDKVVKGRQARGEGHDQARLTEKDAREILHSDKTQSKLAEEYGVTIATISRLKRGRSWGYVKDGQSVDHAYANSQTGIKGVSPRKDKFQAVISLKGKRYYLGIFSTTYEAEQIVISKREELACRK